MKKILFISTIVMAIIFFGCQNKSESSLKSSDSTPENEVFYLIFPRSFYDSNGDRVGDLNGVVQKLDYLEELGVTSIIMTPLYPSIFYHNYFADDFEGIDKEFGSMDDYHTMISEIHKRKMKFYMDTEVQYVTKNHKWFKESYQNPGSEFSHYVFYHDSLNKDPEPIIFNLPGIKSYNGDYLEATTVNLYNDEVRKYVTDLYAYWVDPNGDGNFEDGVDGFRLDHMMDNLDNKDLLPDMFESFWKPLIQHIKSINPNVKFIAEQADWGNLGMDYFSKADVDIVYAFGLIRPLDVRSRFIHTLDTLLQITPADKYQFLFLENHDLPRYAGYVDQIKGGQDALKASAVAVLLNKGIPFIYYGQELGMRGTQLHGENDGNDIPIREAFEWSRVRDAEGMALWYKDTGPWWDSTTVQSNDGISVEEQEGDPQSLLNFYKELIALRKDNPGLSHGEGEVIETGNPELLTFARWAGDSRFLVGVNISRESLNTEVLLSALPFQSSSNKWEIKLGDGESSMSVSEESIQLKMKPMGFVVLKLN